jgi:alkyl hydroperoxide reductase subunit F
MLDAKLKTQLKAYLEKITQPIEIVATLDDGAKSREMRSLLQEIESLSGKITLVERADAGVRAPSFAINRAGSDIGMRFAAIPLGHEFTSLVLALLQVGGHPVNTPSRPTSPCPARTVPTSSRRSTSCRSSTRRSGW